MKQKAETMDDVLDKFGHMKIARHIGVTRAAVGQAKRVGSFPASWYAKMVEFGEENKIEIPIGLFNMKGDPQEAAAE